MKMKLGVPYKIALMFAVPMIAVLSFVFYLNDAMRTLDQYQALQTKEAQISFLRDRGIVAFNRARTLQALYVTTEDPEYKEGYIQNANDAVAALDQLASMVQDDPEVYRKIRFFWRGLQQTRIPGFLMTGPKVHFTMSDLAGGQAGIFLYHMYLMQKKSGLIAVNLLDHPYKTDLDLRAIAVQQKIEKQLLISAGVATALWILLIAFFKHSITSRLDIVHSNIGELVKGTYRFRKAGKSDEIDDINACVIESGEQMKIAEEGKAQAVRLFAEELSRPLNALKEMLRDFINTGFTSISEKGTERLETATSETERLELLVADLIKVQGSHIAGYDLQVNDFELSTLALNAASSLEEFAKSRAVEIRAKLQRVNVRGDEQRVIQVIINLLSNAIKFSPPNSSVFIATSRDGQQGMLSVVDEGPGISESFRQKIFTRFEQSAITPSGGTGLGLAISRELMQAQSGRLDFESPVKEGKGSRFFISLPASGGKTALPAMPQKSDGLTKQKYRQTLWLKGAVIISLPFVIHLAMCAALYQPLASFRENISQLSNERIIANVRADVIEHGLDGSYDCLVANAYKSKVAYKEAKEEQRQITECIGQLKQLHDVPPNVARELVDLEQMANEHIRMENEVLAAPQNTDAYPWLGKEALRKNERALVYTGLLDKINQQSQNIKQRTEAQHQLRVTMNVILIAASLLAALFSTALILLWIKSWTKRIGPLLQNVECLARGMPLQFIASGDDELAYIDHCVHDAFYKLMELKEFKAQMLSVTSHELRTPLTSISAMSEMAEAGIFGQLTEHGLLLIKSIRERISDLTMMVTNLLDLEKMQSGKILVHTNEINLSDAVDAVIAGVNELSLDRKVSIAVSNKVSEIIGDRQRLMQALTALLRHLIQVLPSHSNLDLRCEADARKIDIVLAAPYETASLMQHAARAQLVSELSRAIAEQHGGTFFVSATKDARRYIFQLPARSPVASLAT